MQCYLWDEQQAQSHSHSQMSVNKEQHEHPVRVQPGHQREPAEKHQQERVCLFTSILSKFRFESQMNWVLCVSVKYSHRQTQTLKAAWMKCTAAPEAISTSETVNRGIKAKLGGNYKSSNILEPAASFWEAISKGYERFPRLKGSAAILCWAETHFECVRLWSHRYGSCQNKHPRIQTCCTLLAMLAAYIFKQRRYFTLGLLLNASILALSLWADCHVDVSI